tara:strand:- start:953 stop:2764 length:1812 start_codon:yes stop_codon:yes gene_type:complete
MAIKVNGVTVIDDDRKGIFNKVSAGNYTTAEREALGSLSEGELVYDTTAKKLFIYDGSAWAGVGGGGGNGLVSSIPPFAAHAHTDTFLKSTDGKVQFSLDNSTYTTTLAVPRNTQYFVGWGTDIRHASNGSSYSVSIGVTFPQVGASGTTKTIDYEISSVDKVPDAFGFTSMTDVQAAAEFESDIVNPFESINAPASIWVTSDASAYKLRIGAGGTWFDPPGLIGTAFVVNRNEEIQVKHTAGSSSDTNYQTTVNVGYGTEAGQFVSADFNTRTLNAFINKPTLTSPSQGAEVNQNAIDLVSSAISGIGYGSHASSDWQVATDSNFSNIFDESLADTSNLTSYTADAGTDTDDQTFYIRVRYRSATNVVSPYSDTVSVTGKRFYTWRLTVYVRGQNGFSGVDDPASSDSRGGGGGTQIGKTVLTMGPTQTSSGTLVTDTSFSSGGTGSRAWGQHNLPTGNGGGASAATLSGTRILVGGGGGGGSRSGGSNGGTGQAANIGGTSSANNGQNGPNDLGRGAGGGGGAPGSGASSRNVGGGGGGGFGLAVNTSVGDWTVTTTQSTSDGQSVSSPGSFAKLERSYNGGSFTEEGTRTGAYNGNIADI